MNISAVFEVKQNAIDSMLEKEENKRLDYLLGLDDDQSFENYIIGMEDFMETPSLFYSLIQTVWPFLKEMNTVCLYNKNKYKVYDLSIKGIGYLYLQFKNTNEDLLKSAFANVTLQHRINSDYTNTHEWLIEKALQFKNMITSANANESHILFVFSE